jgi:molybdopterin molybdotransferase
MSADVQNLSYAAALTRLLEAVQPVETTRLEIGDAFGHVLATEVKTPRPFPDTMRSAVDGYALGTLDTTEFSVLDTLAAEDLPRAGLSGANAVAVMTGATVPDGSQAVIRVESTSLNQQRVTIQQQPEAGENINRIGEEFGKGELVLPAGVRLDAVRHSVLCYLGLDRVKVYRRPRVGVLITGNELLKPGQSHRPGMVYESNSFVLSNTLRQLGMDVVVRGPVEDKPEVIAKVVDQLAWQNDLVVTSGGVSVGQFDYIRPLLQQSGFDLLVDRTRIKPGRPMLVARRDQKLFFGMPGYPAAFLTNIMAYLIPVLRKLSGLENVHPSGRIAKLAQPVKGREKRWDFVRVKLAYEGSVVTATPVTKQMTSQYISMAHADGLIILDDQCSGLAAGTEVKVMDFASALN